jgi:pimeloyl-ACP methyl ester carboxylesterase
VEDVFHYGFDQLVPLRYDFEIDGSFYQTPPPPPSPITILHGTKDEVVPVSASREYARAYPDQVKLYEVDAGHDINDCLPLIWELVQQCLADNPV